MKKSERILHRIFSPCFFKIAKKGTLKSWEEFDSVPFVVGIETVDGDVLIKSTTSDADITFLIY